MTTMDRPDRGEAGQYFFTYIDQVPAGDIRAILQAQLGEMTELLRGIGEERSLDRYEPGKWTIREVAGHVNDCERLFVFRALWFARGLEGALPSFDQDVAMATAAANDRTLAEHIAEFEALRTANVAFFRHLPEEAWARRGIASDNSFTVRAMAYIAAGHAAHHARILRERYLRRP